MHYCMKVRFWIIVCCQSSFKLLFNNQNPIISKEWTWFKYCEKYLANDVGETTIKYTLTDKNAETNEINEIKTIRERGKLFESFYEIILPHLNQIACIALSFPESQ